MARILFTAYGSAGDVLPSLAVADRLRTLGHEPQFLSDRWLGLYPRSAGFRTVAVGGTGENRVLDDTRLFTTRFNGLESRRRIMTDYVLPFLDENYLNVRELIIQSRPDLVVGSPLGLWGSLAAAEIGIPWVALHLYPDLLDLRQREHRSRTWRFGLPLAQWLEAHEARLGYAPSAIPVVEWGASGSKVLVTHDPAMISELRPELLYTGFPYWDGVLGADGGQLEAAKRFLQDGDHPALIVCLGSFIGLREPSFWQEVAGFAKQSKVSALLVGLPQDLQDRLTGGNVLACGYLPMSQIVSFADAVVHHGGIGTMYGVARAGVPAVVVPRAFDQPYNGRLLEQAGGGFHLPNGTPSEACSLAIDVTTDISVKRRVVELSHSFIESSVVVDNIAQILLNEISVTVP